MNILSKINSPGDIKGLNNNQLDQLCGEIREFLIDSVSKTGGHLASNLGVVELTVAIHRVYDTAEDRLVFDVGHQSYVHKLLTGRREDFSKLRQFGGLSGFPKPGESPHDAFVAGHASNSISVALGMARERTRSGANYSVAALIGDGALTGGLAYEGLSDAGQSGERLVIILNDNAMSINGNVGGMSKLLSHLRTRPGYMKFKLAYRNTVGRVPAVYNFTHRIKEWIKSLLIPKNMFADMGYNYMGPVDGHDADMLESVLRWAKASDEPVLVHVITKKGRDYPLAEADPESYHGVGAFDPETGLEARPESCFSAVFGKTLVNIARKDEAVMAITAAMSGGTGLSGFAEEFPDRFFDVGIAEGHAASMAAGMAKQGGKPVFAVYSSFLQRSYDMLIHDLALQKLHVVLSVDRAGLVGADGETHQGVFDVAYLSSVPGMTILCPSDFAELEHMLTRAVHEIDGPVAVRYPRGGEGAYTSDSGPEPSVVLRSGADVTLVGYGININEIIAAADILAKRGVQAEIVKLNMINPLNTRPVRLSVRKTGRLVVMEDVCRAGCVGARLLAAAAEDGIPLKGARLLNVGDGVVAQGSVNELMAIKGIDAAGIARAAAELMGTEVWYEEDQA